MPDTISDRGEPIIEFDSDPSGGSPPRAFLRRFRSDAGVRAAGANAVWLVADRLFGIAAGVAVTAALVRYLGPADYGLWTHALAVVGLLAPFAQMGIDAVVVRELVEQPAAREEIVGTAFVVLFVCAALLVPAALVAALVAGHGDRRSVVLISVLSLQFMLQATLAIDYWFRAVLQSKYTVWSTKAALMVGAVVTLLLIAFRAPVTRFAAAVVVEAAVSSVLLVRAFQSTGARLSALRFSAARARQLLRAGWPYLVGIFAGSIYTKIDFIMLRELRGVADVGIYSAAVKVSELWIFVPIALATSLFPSVMRMRDAAPRRMQQLYDVTALGAYAVVIPTMLLAKPVILVVFGREFAAAAPILAVHIWTFFLISIGLMRNNWLVAENLGYVYMTAAIAGAAVNVVLDLVLVPRYGGMGAAWASVAAQATIVYGASLLFPRVWPALRQTVVAIAAPVRLLVAIVSGRGIGR